MLAKVFSYAWRWIVRPGKAAEDQLYEERNVWIGFWTVAIFGLLYAITALLLWLAGFKPAIATILPIPRDSYYLWQTFFTIPWAVLTWFFAGAVIHLWNHIFSRERRLADILGPLGFALSVPWFFFTWIPETFVAPVLGPWGFPPWHFWAEMIRLAIGVLWMAALIFIAARKVYEANWLRALGSAILGLAVFAVMFLIFLR